MINRILSPRIEAAYTLLRVFAGLMFAFHGMQKLFGVLSPMPSPPDDMQMLIGGVIELVCGLAVAAGFMTRWAAFLASGTMAVAYIQFHWKLKFGAQFFPAVNQGELALVYCFLFLFIACRGAGQYSVDAKINPSIA